MPGSQSIWKRLLGGLAAPGLLALAGGALADPPQLPLVVPAPPAAAAPALPLLDLAACKALALDKQPAVAAARASLAAAVARKQALDNLKVPTLLARDLPARRDQACLGVSAAEAVVALAEIDTYYAVQFGYISYSYALWQRNLADDTLGKIEELLKAIKDSDQPDEDKGRMAAKVLAARALVEGRREEAMVGMVRGLSSLREAIGAWDCPHILALPEWVLPAAPVCCKDVVELALARRPEIHQASLGVEVTDLEICAQRARCMALSVWTFAAGSDIHANPLPPAIIAPGYRPGAVGPEMPVTINGKRCDRAEQAQIYNGRATTVLDKARSLIRLETDQAYLRMVGAAAALARYEQGVAHARKALPTMKELVEKAPTGFSLTPTGLLNYITTARQLADLRFEVNRTRYELLLARIALERATAGGFCAEVEKAPVAPAPGH
jgi:outer membrane protein TolC